MFRTLAITTDEQRVVRRRQAEAQIGARKAIYVGNLVTACLVAASLLPYVPIWQLSVWLAAVAVAFHPAWRRWMVAWRSIGSGYRVGQWDFRMAATGAVAGGMWVLPLLLFLPAGSHGHQMLLAYLVIGLTSVTFSANPVNTALCLSYALAIGLPTVARGMASGDDIWVLIGILIVPYLGFLLAHQRASFRHLLHGIRREQHAEGLRAEVAAANRLLNRQVGELADARSLAESARAAAVEARDAAQAATRAKSQFLANMSHELRTPLNAILGFSEMLRAQMLGPVGNRRYVEYAGDIHRSGQHLLSIINDILDMSKIEAGRLELHDEVAPVAGIVESALRIVADQARIQGLRIVVASRLDGVMLNADQRAVRQMLLNLLSNAIKFTPGGGRICVDCRVRPNGELSLAVADTGVGIASHDLDRVQRPFGQVDNALTRSWAGTGLGLSLVKSLIELHGGRLRIASALGEGTTVDLIFPRQRVRPAGELSVATGG